MKEVRGFFRLGGVRFWYGCPMRRAMGKAAASAGRDEVVIGLCLAIFR